MASELKVDNISEKTANAGVQLSSSLGFVSKTTAQINALSGMAAGDTVYDSDLGTLKVYNGTDWNGMSESTFPIAIDYLVVAGGGGSGVDNGAGLGYTGGSGAGGYLSSKDTQGRGVAAATTPEFAAGTNITLTVGAGGPSEAKGSSSVFYNVTALGGGIPSDSNAEKAGGCGAGASASSIDATDIGGIGSHGYDGGDNNGANGSTGGGGGAGGAGGEPSSSSSQTGGNGGIGAVTTILSTSTATTVGVGEVSGNAVYFSGGGGGGAASTAGTGGLGGGANGNINGSGATNTGGGCGGTYNVSVSGAGGSGVVILRYPTTHTLTDDGSSNGLTVYTYTEGSFKVSVYTAGTGTITV
jgi:mucin-19